MEAGIMKFLAKLKDKQMQKRIGGILCGLLCVGGGLTIPGAWATDYYGTADGTLTKNQSDSLATGGKAIITESITDYGKICGGYYYDSSNPQAVTNNNEVSVSGSNIKMTPYDYGGYSSSDATCNKVSINNIAEATIACGGYAYKGNANYNIVSIDSAKTISREVYGGWVDCGNANNNRVSIKKSDTLDHVYGGYVDYGNAENNTINIDSVGLIRSQVFCGKVRYEGSVIGNAINMNNITKMLGDVEGGTADGGDAKNNTVSIKNSNTFEDSNVHGGFSFKGNAVQNVVSMNNIKKVIGNIYGGSTWKGSAISNTVIIDNITKMERDIHGGSTNNGDAYNNTLSISNVGSAGIEGWHVSGGTSHNGSAYKNTVTIDHVTEMKNDVSGGTSERGSDYENEVTIRNSNITSNVYGGYNREGNSGASYNVNKNTVALQNTNVGGNVYGGCDGSEETNITATIQENTISLQKGSVTGNVYGGYSKKSLATIKGNLVTLQDTNVGSSVYGGYDGSDNTGTIASIQENIISLQNASVTGDVYGGYSKNGLATIKGNLVTLQNAKVGGKVCGGYSENAAANTNIQDNALKIIGKNNEAGNVQSFDRFNFVCDDTVGYQDKMLIIKGVAGAANNTSIKNDDNFTFTMNNSAKLLAGAKSPGTVLTLVDNQSGGKIIDFEGTKNVPLKGALLSYDGKIEVSDDQKQLNLTIGNVKGVTPEAKAVTETKKTAAFVVNNMVDFLQGRVAFDEEKKHITPFVEIGGSKMRYGTGSHVDVHGWNGALGMARKVDNLACCVALEHGFGNYDAYPGQGLHGKGDIKATGGVIYGELKQDNGVYIDASLRAGRVKSDYHSSSTSYNESSAYYGFSLGGGKEIAVNDKAVLDLYGRYYYMHTNSSDAVAETGEAIAFDAVNSQRIRIGGRYSIDINEAGTAYAGLAWQYEFGSDAKAAIYGLEAPTSSFKGHSGIVEAGYKLNAGENLILDFNLNGVFGKQRGIGGALEAQWLL